MRWVSFRNLFNIYSKPSLPISFLPSSQKIEIRKKEMETLVREKRDQRKRKAHLGRGSKSGEKPGRKLNNRII